MKTKKIVSKIIIMILVFLTVILIQNTVNAAELFSSRWGGRSKRPAGLYRDLVYDTGVYCMQKNVQIYRPAWYNLDKTITIEGDKCNGTTNRSNAIMGYILACPDSIGGEKRYTDNYGFGSGIRYGGKRQQAIWYYMNTWLRNCGLGKYCVWGNGGRCDFMDKAEEYADNINSQEKVYTATISIYISTSRTQRLMTVVTGEKVLLGSLTVKKTDKDNTNKKLDMKFKVETTDGWLSGTEGSYRYNNSFNAATVYSTTSGTATLKGLIANKKYRIWEVQSQDNSKYPLEEQAKKIKGYVYDKNKKALRLGDWFSITAGGNVEKSLVNIGKISISGYIWVDKETKGPSSFNGLFNETNIEGEKKLAGVKVSLKNVKDNRAIGTITTGEGNYEFKNVIFYDELDNYYIEFDYSNLTINNKSGKCYIPVKYNYAKSNGSKAMMEQVAQKDADLTGIARTYKNDKNLENYKFSKLAVNAKLYNKDKTTLENINLGIRPIKEPKYEIYEDLKYVKIVLNNHQYVYEYGKKPLTNVDAAPTVQVYSRAIYPSAIYNLIEGKNTDGQIRVYVVYDIAINNLTKEQDELIYKETNLHITSLTNTFDTNRYEIPDEKDKYRNASVQGTNQDFINFENSIKGDFDKWNKTDDEKTLKYSREFEVGPGAIEHKYIEFKIKDAEIIKILNNSDEGITETEPTKAKSNGYHNFSRYDYSWKNAIAKNQDHISKSQEAEDAAPYLKIFKGKERKITGTVFEDLVVTENGISLGDGKYDAATEKPVSGVIVEIVSGNNPFENATVTKAYLGKQGEEIIVEDAKAITDNNGNFSIEGIMPGDYYIRLTYGDGTQKIVRGDGIVVSIDEYKSTIVTDKAAKNALGFDENKYGKEWYKYLDTKLSSIAVDSLTMRGNHNSENPQTKMFAGTALIDITIENTETNKFDSDKLVNTEIFDGFNFGIIKQPRQTLDITKKIVNIKLVNVPNIIFDGNPQTGKMAGVTDLDGDDKNDGSTYTRVEIDQNSIHGAEITLTYKIEVINTSDVNYYETDEKYKGWYYMFGDSSHSKPVEVQVEEVIDGYKQSLTYISKLENVKEIRKSESDDSIKTTIGKMEDVANAKLGDNTEEYEKALSIKGWKSLKREERDSVSVEFSKTISSEDNDLNYIGVAAIHTAKNAVNKEDQNSLIAGETLKYVKPVILPEPVLAESIITAPTGSLQSIIIATVGIIGAVVLGIAAGVIIKKKKKI